LRLNTTLLSHRHNFIATEKDLDFVVQLTTFSPLNLTLGTTMPAPSDILNDSEIAQAYEDVRSDKSETSWMVLKYESATKDNLKLDKTGTGDIHEMREVLGEDEAAYAYVRVRLGNDEYSERTKFVFVVWAGE
jgi:hypothetical protein